MSPTVFILGRRRLHYFGTVSRTYTRRRHGLFPFVSHLVTLSLLSISLQIGVLHLRTIHQASSLCSATCPPRTDLSNTKSIERTCQPFFEHITLPGGAILLRRLYLSVK